jgi:ketol-acid reductoisomerase
MRKILDEIRSGAFARAWIVENENGRRNFLAEREKQRRHRIEQVGAELRGMMPFLEPVRVVDVEAPAGTPAPARG